MVKSMQPASVRSNTDWQSSRRGPRQVQVSGSYAARPREACEPEEFEEPDPELITIGQRLAETGAFRTEQPAAWHAIDLRERRIQALTHKLEGLERELADTAQQVRNKELELDQLKRQLSSGALPGAPSSAAPFRAEPAIEAADIVAVGVTVRSTGGIPAHGLLERSSFEFDIEFSESTELYVDLNGRLEQGGLFIATYHALPIGTRVDLELELGNGTRLRLNGRVCWARKETPEETPPGLGVEFLELSEFALGQLRASCSRREPRYFEPA